MATPVSIGNFITEIVSKRGGPSNPTLYEFSVAPSATSNIKESMKGFGIEWDQELRFLNYLNNEIQIPGITFQNSEVRQFQKGIPVKMASSKIYNEMDMTFICDVSSLPYRFFRAWIDFVGNVEPDAEKFYDATDKRSFGVSALRFYDEYVCDFTIKKLEKYKNDEVLNVVLAKAWPYSVASIPMSHASQNGLVKLSVSMYYEYAKPTYNKVTPSPA